MQVLYEGSIWETMRCGGIARYFTELINGLPASSTPVLVGPEPRPEGIQHPKFRFEGVRTNPPLKWMRRFWHPAQHGRIAKRIDQIQPDILHWTYYRGLCRRPIQKSTMPSVITLYDFIHEAFPETDPLGNHLRMMQQAIGVADHICCISQTTYDQFCARYPAARERASVIPLGSSLGDVIPDDLPVELVGRPFVLFVGRRSGYKNFAALWHAWNRVKAQFPDLQLALVGLPMNASEQASLQWASSCQRVHLYAGADDALLKSLYCGCEAFVFPSKMEGFGLPILEAMGCGATVLASLCAALQEVAGPAGTYFDSNNPEELAELLRSVAADELSDRVRKRTLGLERVKAFSWGESVEKTNAIYERLVRDGSRRVTDARLAAA